MWKELGVEEKNNAIVFQWHCLSFVECQGLQSNTYSQF